jgi:carboxypeptidase Q
MLQRWTILLSGFLCIGLLIPLAVFTQEAVNADVNARIRKEGLENSKIMQTMHYLTDVYGPRLTGSPNQKNAAEWAVKQMASWGFENGRLEPWDFGHPGWVNERLSTFLVSPVKDSLVAEALAWTPGTNGPLTAQVFHVVVPDTPGERGATIMPTQEELTAYFNRIKDQVKGKIVFVGRHQSIPVNFDPPAKRRDDQQTRNSYDPNAANTGRGGRGGGGGGQQQPQGPPRLTAAQVGTQLDAFLLENGAAVRVNDAGREHGQIRAFNNRTFDTAKVVPTIVMRNEDFGRVVRILSNGTPVQLEVNIVNRSYPEGRTAYNAIAEIPGSDKKDEVVMLGGHLDSWHSATGATDNAIGCAVMMEAARIIKALGLTPRRTIRVALWSGEEQGLLGSKAYVKQHFGSFEEPKPEFGKFAGYFNIDAGTGRARGMNVFGPPEAATILRHALAPFEELGVMGAISGRSRQSGGSDHTSFNEAGLPGISVGQDPIEYNSHTWHTNLDTYERIVEEDVKRSAIVIAAAVYHLAMRDEMLPRFGKDQMPARPGR